MERQFKERRKMQIKSNLKTYEVFMEPTKAFMEKLIETENAEFVIDKNVYEIYSDLFRNISSQRLIVIEAIEKNKILDTALEICEKITEIPAKRNATLISIGGGIIQDITGFAANIIYRGIHWIFVPTTLLAACDSCIGGKTSLNYKKFKNLLGTFYPPNEIHICSQMFMSLTERDYKSGLGEVVKFNIMAGLKGLENMESHIDELLNRNPKTVNHFVKSSLDFKKKFIEVDEFDRGERIKLNFAHTFGHSIEVVTDYEIPHGTAVAIGMIMANRISEQRGYITQEIKKRCEAVLLKVIDIQVEYMERPFEEYMKAIRKDKKQVSRSLTSVLITSYGEKSELSIVHDTTESEIQDAINYFIEQYKLRD